MESDNLPRNVSISSEKTMAPYTADSPRVFHSLLQDLHASKIVVFTKLSDVFKKAIPIILIFGIVMIVALIVGNMPMIIDSIAKHTGVEKQIVTETIQQIEVIRVTEQEALDMGLTAEQIAGEEPINGPPPEPEPEGIPDDAIIPPSPEPEPEPTPQQEPFDVLSNLAPKIQPLKGYDFNGTGGENFNQTAVTDPPPVEETPEPEPEPEPEEQPWPTRNP